MDAINFSELRKKLKSYLDKVYNDHEPLIITRKNNENVVLMSIHDYNSLLKTNYLLSTPANAKHLLDSLKNARKGKIKKKNIIE